MNLKICRECGWKMHEDSVQLARRLKNNDQPICKDCYRISKAAAAYERRLSIQGMTEDERTITSLRRTKKLHGISVPYIQRKLNVNYERAKELYTMVMSNE